MPVATGRSLFPRSLSSLRLPQVMSDPSGGVVFVSDPKKPVGGHVLAHNVTHRVSLRKGKAEQRIAKVIASAALPEAEASFAMSEGGVSDYKD